VRELRAALQERDGFGSLAAAEALLQEIDEK
jgi:hypothetical protein